MDQGEYEVTITADLNLNDPNQLQSSTNSLTFTLTINESNCLLTTINPLPTVDEIPTIYHYIDSGSATTLTFAEYTDTYGVGTCGPRLYELTMDDAALSGIVTVD